MVTSGMGLVIGAAGMASIGALFGGIGGARAGSDSDVSYWLIHPLV